MYELLAFTLNGTMLLGLALSALLKWHWITFERTAWFTCGLLLAEYMVGRFVFGIV